MRQKDNQKHAQTKCVKKSKNKQSMKENELILYVNETHTFNINKNIFSIDSDAAKWFDLLSD